MRLGFFFIFRNKTMNANKLEASRVPKQSFAPKNILSKAIEQVKNAKNVNTFNNKKANINRSISLKDSSGPLNLKSIIVNSNSVSNLNVIAETVNENETLNDSQSTLSNRSSLDDINEDYVTSNKYDNGGYKSEMNYNEVRTYRMMNNKFSETYKEIIKSLLTEKLLAYQMQYQSYLPEGQELTNDEVDSLSHYKQHHIEKRNQRRQKNLSLSINNNNNNNNNSSNITNNVTSVRRGSNSFSGGIKPAIKLNRVATAYEKKNPKSPADPSTKFKAFFDSNTNNVVNFANQKRPTLFSAPQSTVEEQQHQDSLFKKSLSKANSNLSYKSLCNSASYGNNSRRSLLTSSSSHSNKSKLKSSESNFSSSNKADSNSVIRLADLMFDGYLSKKEVAIVLEQDPSVYAQTRSNKIEHEPDYLTPAFKIQKFDIKNAKELDQAKQEIYKRYAFIEDPNIRAKSSLNFTPSSKISTSFKRI